MTSQHSIPVPPPKAKYHSDEDSAMLEDESGRIRLVGERLKSTQLVTGIICGALGIATNSGDFEVVDICFAGMAPQPSARVAEDEGMDIDDGRSKNPTSNINPDKLTIICPDTSDSDEWVGVISGLEVGAPSPSDAQLSMLAEYISGEMGSMDDGAEVSRISRLIIAGNSLASVVIDEEVERKPVSSLLYQSDNI